MKPIFSRTCALWLPLAVGLAGVFVFMYAAVQQNYRQGLNDPQIQMAEDAATALQHGAVPASVVPRGKMISANESLAPFIAVYDASGTVLESSGVVDGASPKPPTGVFDTGTWSKALAGHYANGSTTHENRFSWETKSGLRIATVLVQVDTPSGGKFVLAGRNMREVESREGQLGDAAALAWSATELGTFFVTLVLVWLGWL